MGTGDQIVMVPEDLRPATKKAVRKLATRLTKGEKRRDVRSDPIDDLLGRPRGVRMRRHVDMQDATAFQGEDEENVQNVESHRRHGEKVHRDRSDPVVAHERPPSL
jgi:hypothetical protein